MHRDKLFGGEGYRTISRGFSSTFHAIKILEAQADIVGNGWPSIVLGTAADDLLRMIEGKTSFELADWAVHVSRRNEPGASSIVLEAHSNGSDLTILAYFASLDDKGRLHGPADLERSYYRRREMNRRSAMELAWVRDIGRIREHIAAGQDSQVVDGGIELVMRGAVDGFWSTAGRLINMFDVHISHYPVLSSKAGSETIEIVDAVHERMMSVALLPAEFEAEAGVAVDVFWKQYEKIVKPDGKVSTPLLQKLFVNTPLGRMWRGSVETWHEKIQQAVDLRVWFPGRRPAKDPELAVENARWMHEDAQELFIAQGDAERVPSSIPTAATNRVQDVQRPIYRSPASEKMMARAKAIAIPSEWADEFKAQNAFDLAEMHTRIAMANGRLTLVGGSYPDSLGRLRKLVPMLRKLLLDHGDPLLTEQDEVATEARSREPQ